MEKLNILVIEDKAAHRQAAIDQLADHNVKVVSSFFLGMQLLGGTALDRSNNESGRGNYQKDFHVVLTDMNLPVSDMKGLSPECYKPGEEAPYGFVLALRAAQAGARYVGMLTDTNHHQGIMSHALDAMAAPYWGECGWQSEQNSVFTINGAKCLFVHAPMTRKGDDTSSVRVKDWKAVLAYLME